MKKRYLLLIVILLFVFSPSFAQTADPSNVAGYVAIEVGGTPNSPVAIPFGLPFKFWDVVAGVPTYGAESTSPSDIIGDQAAAGGPIDSDRIVKQGGQQAYRDDTGGPPVWTGPLETLAEMTPGDAYWYVTHFSPPSTIVLAGEVDNSGDYGTTAIPAPTTSSYYATPYSWRDSRFVPIESLGLLEQGFTGDDESAIASDKIVMQGGSGLQLNYIEGVGWDHGFTHIVPGIPYWIVNKHVGHPWDYNYVGVPELPSVSLDDESVVTGMNPLFPIKSSTTIRATTSAKKNPTKTSKESAKILK